MQRNAVYLPYSQCRAPLPFYLDVVSVRSNSCHTVQSPGGAALARVREHLWLEAEQASGLCCCTE